MKRSGPLRERIALRTMRSLGVTAWRLGERLGIDVAGATEGPPFTTDRARRETFDELVGVARAGDGTLDAAASPYPVNELLTHLVVEHGLLLHGSNDTALEALEPRPARDYDTELQAVVACDDGIWPIFYAVVARDRIEGLFTACTHLGAPHACAVSTCLRSAATRLRRRPGREVPSTRCRAAAFAPNGGMSG